jgi:hypothetical protein
VEGVYIGGLNLGCKVSLASKMIVSCYFSIFYSLLFGKEMPLHFLMLKSF